MTGAVLKRIQFGLHDVTEMDGLVNVERQSPRDAARTWMRANEDRTSSWMKP
jgi:glycine betaine/proline transport system substrate-binding protein